MGRQTVSTSRGHRVPHGAPRGPANVPHRGPAHGGLPRNPTLAPGYNSLGPRVTVTTGGAYPNPYAAPSGQRVFRPRTAPPRRPFSSWWSRPAAPQVVPARRPWFSLRPWWSRPAAPIVTVAPRRPWYWGPRFRRPSRPQALGFGATIAAALLLTCLFVPGAQIIPLIALAVIVNPITWIAVASIAAVAMVGSAIAKRCFSGGDEDSAPVFNTSGHSYQNMAEQGMSLQPESKKRVHFATHVKVLEKNEQDSTPVVEATVLASAPEMPSEQMEQNSLDEQNLTNGMS